MFDSIDHIEYNFLPGRFAVQNDDLLSQCSDLYSNHYGIWSDKGIHPQEHIRLSKKRLREWLENDNVSIYYAKHEKQIVGYAISFSKKEDKYGIVSWVTQLVVHTDYRHRSIAKNILFSIWGFSNHFAWGIVSANPYAIRALEKATRRRAIPLRIKKNAIKLKNIGRDNVPFINNDTEFNITNNCSIVNTQFFIDHGETMEMIANVVSDDVPWTLGNIDEGWEWFAFTFNDQPQIELSKKEIENMVATSDSVVHQAYSKMNLSSPMQKWMKHTKEEINYIVEKTNLNADDKVCDFGCGRGRHAIELATRNISVVGVDYVAENIEYANRIAAELSLQNVKFYEADCRYFKCKESFSLILCLYDVVGSYTLERNNLEIIKNAYRLLKPSGYAIFSVMNYESTLANASFLFSFKNNANKILELAASNTMENSGNIFKPEYYLVDTDTHLIYRKEQFTSCTGLPVELIVRDKRYSMNEIVDLCKSVGFSIIETKYTNATNWNKGYSATNSRAKEILLICKK